MDCTGQAVNPDISGIGVRLSFYLQSFLLVFLVDRSSQDAPGALCLSVFTSFGLTISAVVQATQNQMSLFQALTVGNLVWLSNFGTFLSLASYSRQRAAAARAEHQQRETTIKTSVSKVQYLATMQTFFSMALTFYVWARVETFGNQDDCAPSVRYIAFFGVEFDALGSGQKLGLAATTLLAAFYIFVTLHEFTIHRKRVHAVKSRAHLRYDEENPRPLAVDAKSSESFSLPRSSSVTQIQMPTPLVCVGLSPPSPYPPYPPFQPFTPASDLGPMQRPKPPTAYVDPMFLSLTVMHVVIVVYFIVNTELLLKRNPAADNSDGQWGFGQIFALILAIPPLLSVVEALKDHGIGRLHEELDTPDLGTSPSEHHPSYFLSTLHSHISH